MKINEPTPEELRLVRIDDLKTSVSVWVFLGCVALGLWGAGILALQVVHWLREGLWQSKTWEDGFTWLEIGYPRTGWVGAQKILDWVMGLPLFTLPLAVAYATFMGWVWYADQDSAVIRDARMKVANWKRVQNP
jgi:hypothetical protein